MKLYIDTSSAKSITLKLDDKEYKSLAYKDKSQKLLLLIDRVLKENKKKLEDITEVEVNCGPGSFTGLRVGVSVANTLGYTLDIPVNGKLVKKGEFVEITYNDIQKPHGLKPMGELKVDMSSSSGRSSEQLWNKKTYFKKRGGRYK